MGNRESVRVVRGWRWLEGTAVGEVELLVERLPEELREAASQVAVFYERYDPEEEDLLGVFEGADLMEGGDGHPESLPRITLYLGAIWEMCEGDRKAYREEVRVTFLHELGHYFGWDEREVEERGLG